MWRTQLQLVLSVVLAKVRPAQQVLAPSAASFVVKPYEADLNLHMNHVMYLKYFSRAQGGHFLRTQYIGLLYLRGWSNFIVGTHLSYLRAVKPLERLSVRTQLVGADEKYVYCEQVMTSRGHVAATSVQRMMIVDRRGQKVAPHVAFQAIASEQPPAAPHYREHFRPMVALRRDAVEERAL